jgi:hypothetical protein
VPSRRRLWRGRRHHRGRHICRLSRRLTDFNRQRDAAAAAAAAVPRGSHGALSWSRWAIATTRHQSRRRHLGAPRTRLAPTGACCLPEVGRDATETVTGGAFIGKEVVGNAGCWQRRVRAPPLRVTPLARVAHGRGRPRHSRAARGGSHGRRARRAQSLHVRLQSVPPSCGCARGSVVVMKPVPATRLQVWKLRAAFGVAAPTAISAPTTAVACFVYMGVRAGVVRWSVVPQPRSARSTAAAPCMVVVVVVVRMALSVGGVGGVDGVYTVGDAMVARGMRAMSMPLAPMLVVLRVRLVALLLDCSALTRQVAKRPALPTELASRRAIWRGASRELAGEAARIASARSARLARQPPRRRQPPRAAASAAASAFRTVYERRDLE